MAEREYYPSITELLSVDEIPDNVGFIRDGLKAALSKVFYKRLILNTSQSGDYAFTSFDIVLLKKLAIKVPGVSGMAFVLNPDDSDASITSIPVTAQYKWPILGVINDFNLSDFSEGIRAWLDLFMTISGLSIEELFQRMIEVFVPNSQGLKGFINEFKKIELALPEGSDLEDVSGIIEQIEDAGLDVLAELIEHFIDASEDLEESFARLKEVFMAWLGDFSWDYVKEMLIPYVSLSIQEIRVGLEFPREWLIPIDDDSNRIEDEDVHSLLSFDFGSVSFNTVDGIEFHESYNFNFQRSEILGTGLILEVENLQVDLSEKNNIGPADSEGRDVAFKGVYIESAEISLPALWEKDESEERVKIIGSNLLIGSEGGLSGTIGLEEDASQQAGALSFKLPGDCTLALERFGITFKQNRVEAVEINGSLIIAGLEDEEGEDKEISIEIDYDAGVYSIAADTSEGIPVRFGGAELNIQAFELSFDKDGIIGSSISGVLGLENVQDQEGNDAEIEFEIELNDQGFIIRMEESEGLVLAIPNVMDIIIYKLDLGYQNKLAFFELKSDFIIHLDAPLFGKYIPDSINIENFYLDSKGNVEDVSIAAVWSDLEDAEFSASEDGVSLRIPMNATILDAVHISAIQMSLMKAEKGADLEVLLAGGFSLGPIDAVVEDTGISVQFDYKEDSGKVGPMDINLAFVPPAGVGLAIDTGIVKGGGYLYFNADKGEYAGVGEVSIKEVLTVSAVAIITTKPPAGATEPGFSLLLLIAAEFPAIQLGFGFTLNGIGGLFAANRDVDLDALRNGVGNGTINNIMFPNDPVANAPQIINQLSTVFPLDTGSFTFGIMAKLGWGTPTLISLEAGLIVKVPSPIKIAIIGVLESILPSEELQILALVVSFAGTVDTENQMITFDASLNGSKLLGMSLNGDMAFRLKWGNQPMFLLSVGGFHPEYQPPQVNLPSTFRRLSLEIFKGNPRLTLSGYFAITPNTLQFGASVDLYVKSGKFNITGFTKFNTLIQFNPFYLQVAIDAGLSVKWGKMELLGVDFGGSLKGPSPWIAHGYAEFRVVVKIKVKVDVTVGKKKETTLPEIQVLQLLLDELDIDKNYDTITEGSKLLASSRFEESDPEIKDKLLVHPVGKLKFEQLKVPLNVTLEKIGTRYVTGNDKFTLSIKDSRNKSLASNETEGQFAPGEFFDLSLKEKLSRPSFEEYENGLTTSDSEFLMGDDIECTQDYEVQIVDVVTANNKTKTKKLRPRTETMTASDFNVLKTFNGVRTRTPAVATHVIMKDTVKMVQPKMALAFDGKSAKTQFSSFNQVFTHKQDTIVTGGFDKLEIIPNYELFK